MKALAAALRLILRDNLASMGLGALLGVLVLVAGAGLLALSGWFITAAAAAGIAGAGAVFNVFGPSAMVRFLALGRTAARYGERVLTHDATLRSLAGLRGRVLAAYAALPYDRLARLRGEALNRITADVDALDGLPLRLLLPLAAGLTVLALAFAALWALVAPAMAVLVVGVYLLGGLAVLVLVPGGARRPSRRAQAAARAFRLRMIDLIRARADLAVFGRLQQGLASVEAAEARRRVERARLDGIERRVGLALTVLAVLAAAGALGLGMALARAGAIGAPAAAIGFFTALALAETMAPLRRAVADIGGLIQAARRVVAIVAVAPDPAATGRGGGTARTVGGRVVSGDAVPLGLGRTAGDAKPAAAAGDPLLVFEAVGYRRDGAALPVLDRFDLRLAAGQSVALTGASGVGKSTVLLLAARMLAPAEGTISLGGLRLADWDESLLRARLALVPQRPALMAGSLRQALTLGAPDAEDALIWAALGAVALDDVVRARGGLDARLGAGGAGLSGGEARRLALARAVLRRPAVLLLDEPTEGLDHATACRVLSGLRRFLPGTAMLTASHRDAETDWAQRLVHLP